MSEEADKGFTAGDYVIIASNRKVPVRGEFIRLDALNNNMWRMTVKSDNGTEQTAIVPKLSEVDNVTRRCQNEFGAALNNDADFRNLVGPGVDKLQL